MARSKVVDDKHANEVAMRRAQEIAERQNEGAPASQRMAAVNQRFRSKFTDRPERPERANQPPPERAFSHDATSAARDAGETREFRDDDFAPPRPAPARDREREMERDYPPRREREPRPRAFEPTPSQMYDRPPAGGIRRVSDLARPPEPVDYAEDVAPREPAREAVRREPPREMPREAPRERPAPPPSRRSAPTSSHLGDVFKDAPVAAPPSARAASRRPPPPAPAMAGALTDESDLDRTIARISIIAIVTVAVFLVLSVAPFALEQLSAPPPPVATP